MMNTIQKCKSFLRYQVLLLLAVSLVLLWSVVAWDYRRTEDLALEQSRRETAALVMVFANHAETTFRDVDHTLLVLRDAWLASPTTFADEIAHHQDLLDGTALQIAIIDAKGLLVFSNLGLPTPPPLWQIASISRCTRSGPRTNSSSAVLCKDGSPANGRFSVSVVPRPS